VIFQRAPRLLISPHAFGSDAEYRKVHALYERCQAYLAEGDVKNFLNAYNEAAPLEKESRERMQPAAAGICSKDAFAEALEYLPTADLVSLTFVSRRTYYDVVSSYVWKQRKWLARFRPNVLWPLPSANGSEGSFFATDNASAAVETFPYVQEGPPQSVNVMGIMHEKQDIVRYAGHNPIRHHPEFCTHCKRGRCYTARNLPTLFGQWAQGTPQHKNMPASERCALGWTGDDVVHHKPIVGQDAAVCWDMLASCVLSKTDATLHVLLVLRHPAWTDKEVDEGVRDLITVLRPPAVRVMNIALCVAYAMAKADCTVCLWHSTTIAWVFHVASWNVVASTARIDLSAGDPAPAASNVLHVVLTQGSTQLTNAVRYLQGVIVEPTEVLRGALTMAAKPGFSQSCTYC
jgi:hypothetical protein